MNIQIFRTDTLLFCNFDLEYGLFRSPSRFNNVIKAVRTDLYLGPRFTEIYISINFDFLC
jgi:hypothetical protein